MSYSLDLDEYSQERLEEELAKRKKDQEADRCDYCHRLLGIQPSCKFPNRHYKKSKQDRNINFCRGCYNMWTWVPGVLISPASPPESVFECPNCGCKEYTKIKKVEK